MRSLYYCAAPSLFYCCFFSKNYRQMPKDGVCTGNSTTQVKALADNVVETLKEEYGTEPLRLEGYKTCQWILIDYGSVVIHVFKNDMRDFYSLERLWGDAEKLSYK